MDAVDNKNLILRYAPILLLAILVISFFVSCQTNHKKRPFGWFRLGKVVDFLSPETDLKESRLVMRRDEKGLYVMSTICTYDLTYLTRKKVSNREIFVSDYSTSSYDLDGNVLTGPAVVPLPHYELRIDFGVDGKSRDTLYAIVGQEVSRDWRLPLPHE